ncbi:hypothetical protein [Gemmobacter sp.]|uniref:hypothetical protein n=1 Tax=Gemmobacter sp. TaxID=1898957 RepID=UPI002AFE07F1|nr:hypothetical protein [Gemmobacter sp.]
MPAPVFARPPTDVGGTPTFSSEDDVAAINALAQELHDDIQTRAVAADLGTAADQDVGAFATAAQGALADSAVQPGDPVSDLAETASAKILTAAERAKLDGIQAGAQVNAVTSVAGRAGDVVLTPADAGAAPASHTHPATEIRDSTAAGRALLTAPDAPAQRAALELGTAATQPASAFATAAQGGRADSAVQPATLAAETAARVAAVDAVAADIAAETAARGAAVAALAAAIDAEATTRAAADAADATARIAGDAAAAAALLVEATARARGDGMQPRERPEYADAFASQLEGVPADLAAAPGTVVVDAALGSAVRLDAAATIGARLPVALEPGRTYRARWALRRATDATDPLNDAVVCGIRWLAADKSGLGGANAELRAEILSPTVADGVIRAEATVSVDLETDFAVPSGAIYARPFARTYGDGVTHISVIELAEVPPVTVNNTTIDAPAGYGGVLDGGIA